MFKKIMLLVVFMTAFATNDMQAQQQGFLGEVKMFAGNFAPQGWAFCDGTVVQISQNSALYSILGTTYGGDGRTTFNLPDLRGRVPVQAGTGPGLSQVRLGVIFGREKMTITETGVANIPVHEVSPDEGGELVPGNEALLTVGNPPNAHFSVGDSTVEVDNRQPSLGMNYIICISGTFPTRN